MREFVWFFYYDSCKSSNFNIVIKAKKKKANLISKLSLTVFDLVLAYYGKRCPTRGGGT